jgi:hypothetical protein
MRVKEFIFDHCRYCDDYDPCHGGCGAYTGEECDEAHSQPDFRGKTMQERVCEYCEKHFEFGSPGEHESKARQMTSKQLKATIEKMDKDKFPKTRKIYIKEYEKRKGKQKRNEEDKKEIEKTISTILDCVRSKRTKAFLGRVLRPSMEYCYYLGKESSQSNTKKGKRDESKKKSSRG